MEGFIPEDQAKELLNNRNRTAADEIAASAIEQQESPLGKITETPQERRHNEHMAVYEEVQKLNGKHYRRIHGDKMASRFDFYPVDTQIEVRSADLEEMIYVAGMDVSSDEDAQEKINGIVEACSRITINGIRGNYRDLSQCDKMIVIFSIRDFTIADNNRENKLMMPVVNPKNGKSKNVQITSDSFDYYDIKPSIMKFYDANRRCFYIDDSRLGKPFCLYVPTVGVVDYIIKYWKEQEQLKKDGKGWYDQSFMPIAQFLIDDWRKLDANGEFIGQLQDDWQHNKNVFNYDKKAFIMKMASMLEIGIKPTTNVEFSDEEGGGSVRVPLNFRSPKDIFDISDVASELLGD